METANASEERMRASFSSKVSVISLVPRSVAGGADIVVVVRAGGQAIFTFVAGGFGTPRFSRYPDSQREANRVARRATYAQLSSNGHPIIAAVNEAGLAHKPQEHILIIGNVYPPHTLGGYELMCRDHVQWLRRHGFAVTVLVSTYGLPDRKPADEIGASGERVVRALDFHWDNFEVRRPRGWRLIEGERRQRRVLQELLRSERPTAVQLWHMAAISKSLIRTVVDSSTPTIAVIQESWPVWDIQTDAWFRLWRHGRRRDRIARPALRSLASRLFAPVDLDGSMEHVWPAYCSDFMRDHIEERFEPWRGKGVTIRNAIDFHAMARDRDPHDPLRKPIRLLYVGRVERRKGVETAINALARLRETGVQAALDIVGWRDEAFASELRQIASEQNVDSAIRWLEPLDRTQLPDVYLEHDVLLFPTIWEEPFGLVPLEAMATGCLVVGTGTGGSSELMVEGETALLHPVEDAPALAGRIRELAVDPSLVARLRTNGRRMAEQNDIQPYHEALMRLMRESVDSAG